MILSELKTAPRVRPQTAFSRWMRRLRSLLPRTQAAKGSHQLHGPELGRIALHRALLRGREGR
eukprot:COSAG06_NODE_44425_length_363_cov_1.178030_1_plen_62_part_01